MRLGGYSLIRPPGIGRRRTLLVVRCVIGVALSFARRRIGNLAVPGLAHAVIDAIRDRLRLG
jgi:membrane protease YdiL (CAAX protease family)